MNNGIKTQLEDLRSLVKKLEIRSEEIKTLIKKANIEDVLIIKKKAEIHMQQTYGIFETLENVADKRANEILK